MNEHPKQESEREKRDREAAYKERLADDLEACGAWQADLHRAKAAKLRSSCA